MKALQIDINGNMNTVEITGKTIEQQNECIHNLLGGYFECVHLSADAVMLVDDEGLIKNLAVNATASRIADYSFLFGTALIVGLMWDNDGDVFCDCPERFLSSLKGDGDG